MNFIRRKPGLEDHLQKIYNEAYQSSLHSILLETQNKSNSALSSWKSTLSYISNSLCTIDSNPKTEVERKVLASILDIKRQCHDRISFLDKRYDSVPQSPYNTAPYVHNVSQHQQQQQQQQQSLDQSYNSVPDHPLPIPSTGHFVGDPQIRSRNSSRESISGGSAPSSSPPKKGLMKTLRNNKSSKVSSNHLSAASASRAATSAWDSNPSFKESTHQGEGRSHSLGSSGFEKYSMRGHGGGTQGFGKIHKELANEKPKSHSITTKTHHKTSSTPSTSKIIASRNKSTPLLGTHKDEDFPLIDLDKPLNISSPNSTVGPSVLAQNKKSSSKPRPPVPRKPIPLSNRQASTAATSHNFSVDDETAATTLPRLPITKTISAPTTTKDTSTTAMATSPTTAMATPPSTTTATPPTTTIPSRPSGAKLNWPLENENGSDIAADFMVLPHQPRPLRKSPSPKSHSRGPSPCSRNDNASSGSPPTIFVSEGIPAPGSFKSASTSSLSKVTPSLPSTPVAKKYVVIHHNQPSEKAKTSASRQSASGDSRSHAKSTELKAATIAVQSRKSKNNSSSATKTNSQNPKSTAVKKSPLITVSAEDEQPQKQIKRKSDSESSKKPAMTKEEKEWDNRCKKALKNIKGVDDVSAQQILNEIVLKGDEVHWDDIAGLDQAKNSLKETVVYPFLRPDLFSGLREPARGMLLFGPPGTGKTMLARAVATESKSTFFSISASSLMSKFLGESEKLVRALFQLAKELSPSIIFVDEIDSLLSTRSSNGEHESSRRIKNEFLIQWSDLQHAAAGKEHEDVQRVLVLAATNIPWSIDEAARRRFVRRQYIPLPEKETRRSHLEKLLSNQKHALTDEEFEKLLNLTDGFSGSDITALAKDAAMGPLRSLGDALLTTTFDEIRPVGFEDFVSSLKTIRPSVSKEGLEQFENWATLYGSSGA